MWLPLGEAVEFLSAAFGEEARPDRGTARYGAVGAG